MVTIQYPDEISGRFYRAFDLNPIGTIRGSVTKWHQPGMIDLAICIPTVTWVVCCWRYWG